MSESTGREDALDEDALEASTVIERRKGPEGALPVRLSPLQPVGPETLARGDIPAVVPAIAAEPRVTRSGPAAADPEPPPLHLLRSGTEPARPLSDPWPSGSARRQHAPGPRMRPPSGGRGRLVLVAVLGFAAGVLVRDRSPWPWSPAPAPVAAVTPALAAIEPLPPAPVLPPPAAVVASPPSPARSVTRASSARGAAVKKRKR